MSPGKCLPFCFGLNVLKGNYRHQILYSTRICVNDEYYIYMCVYTKRHIQEYVIYNVFFYIVKSYGTSDSSMWRADEWTS